MKCYMSLTAPANDNDIYVDLFNVTLKSARKNTTLDLYILYNGPVTHKCYKLMQEYNVTIINHTFSHTDYLKNIYPETWMKNTFGKIIDYTKIAGTFMRMDIPFIEKEEEYVLYVDIDVIFMKDVRLEDLPKPEYLAAAPEFVKDISQMDYFNAGILWLNIPNMRKKCQQIFAMMEKGERNNTGLFDQGYLNQVCFSDMTPLPLEYNWKPYWGINDDAKIIHLHGMKPDGNLDNSGFCMSEEAINNSLKGHINDINGYIYYILIYYDFLSKDGKRWISNFISTIFSIMLHTDTKIKYEKKYKKYKKLTYILTTSLIIIFIMFYLTYIK